MATYQTVIYQYEIGKAKQYEFSGDSYETARWLQEQIKWLRKEPYMVPRFDGEEPLEGLK